MTRRFALVVLGLLPLGASAQDAPADGAGRISQADFKKALMAEAILVIDVRDAASYALGHIPGAISVPEARLSEQFETLKAEKKPIVAYCG